MSAGSQFLNVEASSPAADGHSEDMAMPDLRSALRKLAKAVVVVSAQHNDAPFAMSATAVSEVSLDPPTMLVCVNRRASIHAAIVESGVFCLNILNSAHDEIAHRCGGGVPPSERFQTGHWRPALAGVPRLRDAEASIVCSLMQTSTVGTHDIFIGEVKQVFTSDGCDPLIYVNGEYVRATSRSTVPTG